MAKGMFSQGVCLLSDGSTTIENIKQALANHQMTVLKERSQDSQSNAWLGGDSLVIAYRPEVNGYLSIDLLNKPWPDHMGDPKREPDLFTAWSMGSFGPLAYPAGLERSRQHSWAWREGNAIAAKHETFIRLRLSYVFGADKDAPVLPKDNDPIDEMLFLNQVVVAIGDAPGILCYFNPNGEVLYDLPKFKSYFRESNPEDKLPLLLWSNVRHFNIDDSYSLMDTVGNEQLDIPDVEAIFPSDRFDPGRVGYYLRNVSHYLLETDRQLKAGEAIDGPDENNLTWTIDAADDAVTSPPRRSLRLCPKSDREAIAKLLAAARQ